MMFDPTKPVQTRDGRKARIICRDAKGPWPIVALVDYGHQDAPHCFAANGYELTDGLERPGDLVNIPTKREGWVNVYRGNGDLWVGGRIYGTEDEARRGGKAIDNNIATARIEWEK